MSHSKLQGVMDQSLTDPITLNKGIDESDRPIPGDSYCQNCGSETFDRCPHCEYAYIRLEPPKSELDTHHPPDYCRSCGEAFPWVSTIKEKKAREDLFLNVELENIGGPFYPRVVREINDCYQIKANEATLVLYRKLLESLLVDILRTRYGMEDIELFFDTEEGQTLPFSSLLSNFKASEDDLRPYSDVMNEDLHRSLEKFKYQGDASAHAIEPDISNEGIEEQSERATKLAEILFELRKNIRASK
jgi:hypothetical protein